MTVLVRFFPKRKLITPAPDPELLYDLNLLLSASESDSRFSGQETESVSGNVDAVHFFEKRFWNVTILGGAVTDAELTMFFSSVAARESFFFTDIDTGELVEVTLSRKPKKTRKNPAKVGEGAYDYSAQFEEVLN